MNKRYLPAIAALLIAVTCTSFLPALAQVTTCPNGSTLPCLPAYLYANPTLTVVTIAQDDQLKNTGVMWFAVDQPTFMGTAVPAFAAHDLMSQFKIIVSYQGVPVTPTNFYCQVVEKDKVNPIKNQQAPWENLVTKVTDVSGLFVCKWRPGKPGVGVLDVYYTGPMNAAHIADYVLVVGASFTVGHTVIYGTEAQDICILGWPTFNILAPGPIPNPMPTTLPSYQITKPDGTTHWIYADALWGFVSCEDAALTEKALLGFPIAWS